MSSYQCENTEFGVGKGCTQLAPVSINPFQNITVRTSKKCGVLYGFYLLIYFHGKKKNSTLTSRSALHNSIWHHSHLHKGSCVKHNCSL